MDILHEGQLRHIVAGGRATVLDMFREGEFGAHTATVARMLATPVLDIKEWFALGEQYLPASADLPNDALAAYFHLMSLLLRISTAQRALAFDAEEYCRSDPNALTFDTHDLRQRFVWERSDELNEPFGE